MRRRAGADAAGSRAWRRNSRVSMREAKKARAGWAISQKLAGANSGIKVDKSEIQAWGALCDKAQREIKGRDSDKIFSGLLIWR